MMIKHDANKDTLDRNDDNRMMSIRILSTGMMLIE